MDNSCTPKTCIGKIVFLNISQHEISASSKKHYPKNFPYPILIKPLGIDTCRFLFQRARVQVFAIPGENPLALAGKSVRMGSSIFLFYL